MKFNVKKYAHILRGAGRVFWRRQLALQLFWIIEIVGKSNMTTTFMIQKTRPKSVLVLMIHAQWSVSVPFNHPTVRMKDIEKYIFKSKIQDLFVHQQILCKWLSN